VTRWAAFAGVTAFVLVALLVLARLSRVRPSQPRRLAGLDAFRDGADHLEALDDRADSFPAHPGPATGDITPGLLLANVALSQGLFGLVLVGGAWYAAVPPSALGLSLPTTGTLALGVALGIGLYAANEVASSVADAADIAPAVELRELLAPDSTGGWVLLLGGVLPVVAGFEELLFRGALVGAMHAGFGISPWALAVLSSAAFALGHGAQGTVGIVVTGVLGFALAAVFVLTGSLVVAVVSHYLVNALEFLVHETG